MALFSVPVFFAIFPLAVIERSVRPCVFAFAVTFTVSCFAFINITAVIFNALEFRLRRRFVGRILCRSRYGGRSLIRIHHCILADIIICCAAVVGFFRENLFQRVFNKRSVGVCEAQKISKLDSLCMIFFAIVEADLIGKSEKGNVVGIGRLLLISRPEGTNSDMRKQSHHYFRNQFFSMFCSVDKRQRQTTISLMQAVHNITSRFFFLGKIGFCLDDLLFQMR